MNFLYRMPQSEVQGVTEGLQKKPGSSAAKSANSLEGLITENQSMRPESEQSNANVDGIGDGSAARPEGYSRSKEQASSAGNHRDVGQDEGWITIPCKQLPGDWTNATDIQQLQSLDRAFIFPGEDIHILVCLSESKHEKEIITPFRVAAVMSEKVKSRTNSKHQNQNDVDKFSSGNDNVYANGEHDEHSGKSLEVTSEAVGTLGEKVEDDDQTGKEDVSATELQVEHHKPWTENILQKFRSSTFFVRIAESDEQLWAKRKTSNETELSKAKSSGGSNMTTCSGLASAIVDKGHFDGNKSGGIARDDVKCYTLENGDIVVLLRVNIGIGKLSDPVLEVLQFEKYETSDCMLTSSSNQLVSTKDDPCGELLNWLLPLDRTLPIHRSLSPPLSSTVSQKPPYPSPGSQLFSFGHFRSNSMPTLPQVTAPAPSVASVSNSKPAFELEDFGRLEKVVKKQDSGSDNLLSFRGVPLEPKRFSALCGLEGIYLPGRRWRRKLEIVQPVEIHSFAAESNTQDLLCVQIKNVSPSHIPDIVIFLDAISIVYEDASKGSRPLALPIASVETGNGYELPDLALRRGEEHSFILKLATTRSKDQKGNGGTIKHVKTSVAPSNLPKLSRSGEGRSIYSADDQFAVLVSCRCNYTESKLFFKKPTDWRPRSARDLMISVASDTQRVDDSQHLQVPQLPVQVLTLKATNLTSEDLTLTVLAPETSTSAPKVLSFSSSPTTPMNFPVGSHEVARRLGSDDSSGFTHLWLQSTVPLGCVPAHSSATVKLELLPLTDGIITLDTLQIAVKEKGLTYIPEQPLRIYATSSISTGLS